MNDQLIRLERISEIIDKYEFGKYVISLYIGRSYTWRLNQKKNYIDSILKGFPSSLIIISRTEIDEYDNTFDYEIIDGKQRILSIIEYFNNKFELNGKKYAELNTMSKQKFLNYLIPIMEISITDPSSIEEIYYRLNKPYSGFSEIGKFSIDYGYSEIMLIAKLMTGELVPDKNDNLYGKTLTIDPEIPDVFVQWAKSVDVSRIVRLLVDSNMFSVYSKARKIPLLCALDL